MSKLEKSLSMTDSSLHSFMAAEAILRGTDLAAWQGAEMRRALKEADAGEFASDKDLAKAIEKYAS